MAALPEKIYSAEEYLALEEKAQFKSEYYRGNIYAMAGASVNHTRIAFNAAVELRRVLAKKPCEVLGMDTRVHVKPNDLFAYPDILVVCGKIELLPRRKDTVTNPTLIIEILSESTEHYDRVTKFALYRALPSLRDYVLIDQSRLYVEYFHRIENGEWVWQAFDQPGQMIYLRALDVSVSVATLYEKVDWWETSTNANPQD